LSGSLSRSIRMSPHATDSFSKCQLCGEKAAVFLTGAPTLLRCPACGLLSLAKFPAAEATEALYQDEYYSDGSAERFLKPLEWAVRFFRRLRVRAIERRTEGAGAILDVGCGRGTLLEICQERGWTVLGTQLSQTAIRAARARGVDVRYGELPALALPPGSFNVVTFFHVLEHLEAPEAYLREACRLLKPNGGLVVEVPDFGGLGFRLLGLRHFCVDYPHHLVFFTERSLRALLERSGFEVTGRSRVSLEYSPFTTLQNMLNVVPGKPNRLYRSFMRNAEGKRLRQEPLTWLHAVLAAGLVLPALLVTFLAAPVVGGNTIRLYAQKRDG
jgi:2-polyprenyl-3-methyl-5-hydroxy-6-metoxy-1,4-benzoquinol methylase